MNFIEEDFSSNYPARSEGDTEDSNYYAFFDKPTSENLAANRNGFLTHQQHQALKRTIADQRSSILILIGMLSCAAIVLGIFFWMIDADDGIVSIKAQLLNAGVILVVFGVFAGYFARDWYIFSVGDDLENKIVLSETGSIEWNGRHYQMVANGRMLRSLHSRFTLPPPGEYRFYFLPHTRLVILAEEMTTKLSQDANTVYLRALANSNNFTLADLDQNRAGLLSRRQENQLLSVFAMYLLGLPIAAILFVSMRSLIEKEMSPVAIKMLIFVAAILVLRLGWSALQILVDIWKGKVKSMNGLVERETHRSRYWVSYYYVMDPYRFQISQAAYNALIEGRFYRLFYVPHSRRLVSIEPLQDLKPTYLDQPDHAN